MKLKRVSCSGQESHLPHPSPLSSFTLQSCQLFFSTSQASRLLQLPAERSKTILFHSCVCVLQSAPEVEGTNLYKHQRGLHRHLRQTKQRCFEHLPQRVVCSSALISDLKRLRTGSNKHLLENGARSTLAHGRHVCNVTGELFSTAADCNCSTCLTRLQLQDGNVQLACDTHLQVSRPFVMLRG